MSTLYDRVLLACDKRGVTPGYMCDTIGIRRAYMSELKRLNQSSVSCGKIAAMATFLHVSCDYLIFGVDKNDLTIDERDLLDAYRSAPDSDKETVRFMLRNYMPVDLSSEEVRLA